MHIVENIKYVDCNKFSGLVDGNYCEIEVPSYLVEDIKSGYYDQGPPLPKEEATKIISNKLIKYYLNNIKEIRKKKLLKL